MRILLLDFSDSTWKEDENINHDANFDLPLNVYGHRTFRSLKLYSCNFSMPEFENFKYLTNLSFGWIKLSYLTIKTLLRHCVLLQNLSLKKCWNIETIEITGYNLQLQSLIIEKCDILQRWILIEAPNLKFFKYSGEVYNFDIERARMMEEVDLDFGVESEFREVGDMLQKLLKDLYWAKTLTICSYLLQVQKFVY